MRTELKSNRPTKKLLGPIADMASVICVRIPVITALIAMTVATPTTIPRMVSAERNWNPGRGPLDKFASTWIYGELKKEIKFPYGRKKQPKLKTNMHEFLKQRDEGDADEQSAQRSQRIGAMIRPSDAR